MNADDKFVVVESIDEDYGSDDEKVTMNQVSNKHQFLIPKSCDDQKIKIQILKRYVSYV